MLTLSGLLRRRALADQACAALAADTCGVTAIEYALIAAIMSGGVVTSFTAIGGSREPVFAAVAERLG